MPSLLKEGREVGAAHIVALPQGRISRRPEGHTGKRGVVVSFCEHVMLHSTAERKRVWDPIPTESWMAPVSQGCQVGKQVALHGSSRDGVWCVMAAHRAVLCDYRYECHRGFQGSLLMRLDWPSWKVWYSFW